MGEGRERHDATLGTSPRSAASAASSTSLPLPSPTRQSSGPLPLWPRNGPAPQLSERDSIFATHYLTGDSNNATPRQLSPTISPTFEQDDAKLRDDAIPAFEHPGSHSAVPLPRSGQATKARTTSITRNSALSSRINSTNLESTKGTLSQGSREGAGGPRSHDVDRRIVPEGLFGHKRGISRQREQLQASIGHRMTLAKAPAMEIAQPLTERKGMDIQYTGQKTEYGSNGLAEPRVDSSELPEAEQQIEATITEPLPNTRSRKASHYLGLFKENTEQEDGKKARAKSKEPTKPLMSSGTGVSTPSNSGGVPTSSLEAETITSSHDNRNSNGQKAFERSTESIESAEKVSLSDLHRSDKKPSHARKKETSRAQESIEWRAGESSHGTVPLRLLEEIREHRFPSVDDGNENEDAEIASPVSDGNNGTVTGKNEPIRSHPGSSSLNPAGGNEEDDEDFESDKERISAATYYPHRPPPPDPSAHEQDAVSHKACSQPLHIRQHDTSTGRADDETSEEAPTTAVNSLSSRGSETSAHNSRRLQACSDEEEGPTSPSTPIELFSDTDYESWDEAARSERGGYDSGVTDKGDVTPTATPRTRKYLHDHSQPTPRGAVELKPYKHQVGGHTKVFSFSKQAICKQLNNRENVFYEVIERRHPELLSFLPKYVYLGWCDPSSRPS